ncbi:MAG TPA: hypothetical protein VGZ93_12580 [Candidatus Methylacidiphilales bacterium]|jgi:hypothetical protein|nr:hypothetical protein [Candidatus Methylacidiphilales bacterium]
MGTGIMQILHASVLNGRFDLHNPEYRELVSLGLLRSEVDFLHSLEQCEAALRRADKTRLPLSRRKELLDLWIKLGRPHPVSLRRRMLGLDGEDRRQKEYLMDLEDLVDWSWNSFKNGL